MCKKNIGLDRLQGFEIGYWPGLSRKSAGARLRRPVLGRLATYVPCGCEHVPSLASTSQILWWRVTLEFVLFIGFNLCSLGTPCGTKGEP